MDKISYSYNVVYNAFKRLSKAYSALERAATIVGVMGIVLALSLALFTPKLRRL